VFRWIGGGAAGGWGGDLPILLEGRKVSMLCDMLRWSRRGSWRAGRGDLPRLLEGRKVSMLCDMLRSSRRGSWRAGRMVREVLARSRCSSCCIMGVKAAAARTWVRESI
jgi:hypothetical protein